MIAEYEKAKIAERYRRGKLFRARAGEICFWKVSYGHRRASTEQGGWRIEIYEPEAVVVQRIFRAYVDERRSMREIADDLHDRGIPSPTGKPIWGTSTIGRLLRNEAYIGTVYYNRRESLDGNGPRGARNRKTRYRERPREEWIAIPVPPIIDRDTFERAQRVSRENPKWNPRGAEPGAWLLRGLIKCGHCGVGTNCHKMRGRNGTLHRYYYCRNHDPLRAGGEDRCPERNIRADALDEYVFGQVRQALLDPRQLIAGERAVITSTPPDENELIANQLTRLSAAIDATGASAPAARRLPGRAARTRRAHPPHRQAHRPPPPARTRGTPSPRAAPSSPPRTACVTGPLPARADDRRERVPLPGEDLEHLRELLLEHEPPLVGRSVAVGLIERVADLRDQPLARAQAARQAAVDERWVGFGEHPAHMSPGGALAPLGAGSDEHAELVRVMPVGLDLVVRAAPARGPERDQELREERRGVRL